MTRSRRTTTTHEDNVNMGGEVVNMLPREWYGIFDSVLNVRILPKRLLDNQRYDQCSRKEFSDRKPLKVVIDVLPFFDLFHKRLRKMGPRSHEITGARRRSTSSYTLFKHLSP
jgi:hypothetical protein